MTRKLPKDERIRIRHMLDAAHKAQEFTQGRTRRDLDTDKMLAHGYFDINLDRVWAMVTGDGN